jgi:hypothetical protein
MNLRADLHRFLISCERRAASSRSLARALHYCRGYIRVYTPERGGPGGADIQEPIIQAVRGSMRGSRRSGEVKKDYRVDEPPRPHRRPPYPDE